MSVKKKLEMRFFVTLVYTFSRRAGLVRRIMRVEGLRSALPVWSCLLHGAAINPALPPHGIAANPALPPPSRCRRQPGAAICMVRPGAGGPSTGM